MYALFLLPPCFSESAFSDSLAQIIVYSMTTDGPISPRSGITTPAGSHVTPTTSDASHLKTDKSGSPRAHEAYLAGSKALDSLSRMIISTESFFHPSNSGTWTADLTAFIKYLTSEFNKREARPLISCP
jgi:proteasome activator subunit 4